jgi:hypothetical protein
MDDASLVDVHWIPQVSIVPFYIAEFRVGGKLNINLTVPGIDHDVATAIAHGADAMCPYSKATRGNIDVALNVVTA